MLKLIRIVLLGLLLIFWFLFSLLLCVMRPRHANNVYIFARMYHAVCPLLGLKVTVTVPDESKSLGPAVYVCNHQSNFDIFVATGAVQPGVVAVGKKSLLWIPFFGLIFWLSGNVLIDRANRSRAMGTISQVVDRIKKRGTSIWMFPEGTRSQGRGLLPFKAGAFHTAVMAEVPVVPIVCSSYFGQVDLNRWDNGEILIELLAPICSQSYGSHGARDLSNECRRQMVAKLAELDERLSVAD